MQSEATAGPFRVGQVWETRDGDKAEVVCIAEGDIPGSLYGADVEVEPMHLLPDLVRLVQGPDSHPGT